MYRVLIRLFMMMQRNNQKRSRSARRTYGQETGISVCRQSIAQFVCNRTSGKLQALFYCYTVMAELAAVLAKRRRKSEVVGAVVENTPTATVADAGHTTASTSTEHGGENVSAEVHDDDKDRTYNRADGELKKILQRRRRKSETSSSVFIKEARDSEADAKHTHQAYSDSNGTVGSSAQAAIELRLKSLELKVEQQQEQLKKAEMTVIQNGRRLSTFSPVADGEVVDTVKSCSEPALAENKTMRLCLA